MKHIMIIAVLLLCSNSFASTFETLEYDVTVKITAKNYGDSHDSSNEYKLDLRLQAAPKSLGTTLGVLKASSSKNIYSLFSSYQTAKLGQTITRSSKIILPRKVLTKTLLKLNVLESDLTLPVPGPCCLYINQDDQEVKSMIDLSLGEQELVFQGPTANVAVSITLVSRSYLSLEEVVKAQLKHFYEGSFFSVGKPYESNFYYHILKNI